MQTLKLLFNQNGLRGSVTIPGDKSISHRSIMFGAIAKGKTTISNFLTGADCLSTISCFRKLGVEIEQTEETITVYGQGWEGLVEPKEVLDAGNSGTTTRLMLGILAGLPFHSVLVGDESIGKRPMGRVVEPLRRMGASIRGREQGQYTPLAIDGTGLTSIHYELPIASAQVKSAIIFAGLQAQGTTIVKEPQQTRDHTEKMILQFGGSVVKIEDEILIKGKQTFNGTHVHVPGDISSAAFFLVAGAIVPKSEIILTNIGLNPTRTGILEVLKQMGANIEIETMESIGEETGNIVIRTSELTGIEIGGDLIPKLIDEIPIIALMATQAEGVTIIKDAEELKVKETNRIDTVVGELRKLGAKIEATEDGMIIHGKSSLTGGNVSSFGDHRIGMMLSIAALICREEVELEDPECIAISYPTFFEHLKQLIQ